MRLSLIASLAVAVFFLGSPCAFSDDDNQGGVDFFEKQIRPLLLARCYSCHSEKRSKREGGLTLDLKAGWVKGGENGPAIVPGDLNASLLIRAIRYDDDQLQMPPDKRLPRSDIAKLESWVRMGAPDPRDGKRQRDRIDPSDPIAGRERWAFQPLDESAPPANPSSADTWPRSGIDAFVFESLGRQQLEPAAAADRRTLIRRAYFLLLGLPPQPEEVTAFVNDLRPDAYERLIDRLLASPHFGERWGRHWLDLARFADSNGLDENFLFREAWRYRNWTIAAVNADLPYDQFLVQQIAGDLLPHASIEQRDQQRIAAGFLVIGPKVLLGNDPNERIMDVADEQMDTIGKTVLGLTLGCARCHDHKFDPIPTADYYALAGIFTSTQVMERRYMLGQQRTMERLVGLGENGGEADDAYERYWRESKKLREQAKQGAAALELIKKDDLPALKQLFNKQPGLIAKPALDLSLAKNERLAAQKAQVTLLQLAAKPREIPARAMIPSEAEKPVDESIRIAGQFDQPGDKVARGFLRVLNERAAPLSTKQSGRLELSRWLTQVDGGAGRLAARVMANRIWRHMIGRGLVRTVDNFGETGEPPTHPKLLDYLARELIRAGWSVKSLVREIALSRTFCMSSDHHTGNHGIDPENRWLWRANRRRLDPESLRDAMLLVAGQLDLTPMDSTVSYLGDQATAVGANKNRRRTDFACRSVYLPVIRNDLPELFDVFDFADPHATTGGRPQTMVATQGLFLLNDPMVMESARSVARRVLQENSSASAEELLDTIGELVIGDRIRSKSERSSILRFVRETERQLYEEGDQEAKVRAWSRACHALIASSRFQILE